MAMNKPPKGGQDLDKKSTDEAFRSRKNKTFETSKVADTSKSVKRVTRDVGTQTRPAKPEQTANQGSQAKIHNWELVGQSEGYQVLGQDTLQKQTSEQQQRSDLEESDIKQLERIYYDLTQFPDLAMVKQLSIRFNVFWNVIENWFEKKRLEYRERLKERTLKHYQVQPMQQQPYNQQLLAHSHHTVSQPVVMAQASGSSSNTEQGRGYFEFTAQHLNYLESLFAIGTRYPDISRLAAELDVPEQYLAVWFEKRRGVWKKEQASIAYSRMVLIQQHQLQRQHKMAPQAMQHHQRVAPHQTMGQQRQIHVNTIGGSQVCESLCLFPEATNIPLVEKILSDVANEPTLPLLNSNFDK